MPLWKWAQGHTHRELQFFVLPHWLHFSTPKVSNTQDTTVLNLLDLYFLDPWRYIILAFSSSFFCSLYTHLILYMLISTAVPLFLFISYISAPHLLQRSSAACVEECLLFPPSSPSLGASKGGGPTQGVWRAHRHSPMGGELADAQTTQLYLCRRSILLICFCPLPLVSSQLWTRH